MSLITAILLSGFSLWLLAVLILWRFQEKRIFIGNGRPFGPGPELEALGGAPLRAERDGQALRFLGVPAEGQARGWIVVFHGNSGGADERLDYARRLKPLGLNVMLHELPGYAHDPGQGGGEWPLLRNALAAFDEVAERAAGMPVFVLGESLGTGLATFVAGRREPKALILHTPYTSMADVAASQYPWMPVKRMIRHPIEARLWAPHVKCPVLVLHGTSDPTVPYHLGLAQSKNFKAPLEFVTIPGAAHGNLRDFNPDLYWGSMAAFIKRQL